MFSGQNNYVYAESVDLASNTDYSRSTGSFSTIETNDISVYEELPEDYTADDVLNQFGKYFREEVNKNVQILSHSMLSMLDEQQNHVKRMVSTAGNYKMEQQHPMHGVSSTSDGSLFKQDGAPPNDQSYPEIYQNEAQNEAKTCEISKERYIIRLLTLSSMISSSLH